VLSSFETIVISLFQSHDVMKLKSLSCNLVSKMLPKSTKWQSAPSPVQLSYQNEEDPSVMQNWKPCLKTSNVFNILLQIREMFPLALMLQMSPTFMYLWDKILTQSLWGS